MLDHSTTLPHRARTRLAGAAGAITAAVAVWLVARYGADMHLRTPGFGSSQRPASLGPGFVAVVAVAASLLAWAALALVERAARRPRRAWIITGIAVMAVSLPAPLSGHGLTGTGRLALVCMHLAVGAVLIPVFALTAPRWRSADDDLARAGGDARSQPGGSQQIALPPPEVTGESPSNAMTYYSAAGNVHRLARAVAEGATHAGAQVRLRRVAELAPALQAWMRRRAARS